MRARPVPERPGPGQESVWDYPRPPALRRCGEPIEVRLGGRLICATDESWQVLETSHPPTYYLPRSAFSPGALRPTGGGSYCEWKGTAGYLDVVGGERVASAAAWYYPQPNPGFDPISDHVALYPAPMDSVIVAGERVVPQPGGFYGGWVTSSVVGPFKGEPGTLHW